MAKGRPPKEFSPGYGGDTGADFNLWLEDVDDYMKICQVTDPGDKKCLFLNLAGLNVRRIVKGLVVPVPDDATDDNPGDTYKALTESLRCHFRPSINATSERHKFRQIRQLPDESVSTFMSRLREKVELCSFASTDVDTVVNTQVRDQLIAGLRSQDSRRELLKEPKLTLADALSKAVAMEASLLDSNLYNSEPGPSVAACVKPETTAAVSGSEPKHQLKRKMTKGPGCKYCGRMHANGKQFCPAAHVRCNSCRKVGHFEAVCLSRKPNKANAVDAEEDSDTAQVVYDSIFACSDKAARDQFTMTLMVNGKPCEGLLDTGATRTILTDDVVQPTRSSDRILRAYNGGEVKTLGMADVDIAVGDNTILCECFVVPAGKRSVLFGQDVISQLELLVNAHMADTARLVETAPVSITVDKSARPVAQPARRPPFSAKADIEKELARLAKADIIEPVKEASPWVSPVVPVRKSNGTLRLCVDYRQLNKSIITERHSLPTVDEITSELAGAQVFSVLDAESGFHQLLLEEESRSFTTFASHCGSYRFKRLPFGISCAPEIFQRVVSDILVGLPGVVVYIDDILIFGRNQVEHDARLASVLERLKAANLKLNWAKCHIGKDQVKYLGHTLTRDGVHPDSSKLSAIADMAAPKTVADAHRFLGMVTYLGKFVPRLTEATEPLRQLMKREPFTVNDDLLKAFSTAKQAVVSSLQTLAYFQPDVNLPTAISFRCLTFWSGSYSVAAKQGWTMAAHYLRQPHAHGHRVPIFADGARDARHSVCTDPFSPVCSGLSCTGVH